MRRSGGVGGVGGAGGAGGADPETAAVRGVAARAGNVRCAECDQRGPTYVDVTVGSFVCSRCSGLLRGLTPPHRIKSISMATFTPEEIALIKSRGNDYCRSIWMALFEGEQTKFKDEQMLKDFLSDKYEKKRYYMEPSGSDASKIAKEPPATVQSFKPTDTSIWNNVITKQPIKSAVTPQVPFKVNTPQTVAVSQVNDSFSTPRFPVDFSNAEIFNSSQLNNNLIAPSSSQPTFTAFDKINTNTVAPDRYAALADLDFSFRQQNQSQVQNQDDSSKSVFNPFDGNNSSSVSRNPFYNNTQPINGNSFNSQNPFIMGSGIAPAKQSKNPFL